jgi:hypothetical protein
MSKELGEREAGLREMKARKYGHLSATAPTPKAEKIEKVKAAVPSIKPATEIKPARKAKKKKAAKKKGRRTGGGVGIAF